MSQDLDGNVLIIQAGTPSSAMNSSLAGVITEALNHGCIEEIYGALHGVQGLTNEDFIDLAEESQQTIRGLQTTPGSALGVSSTHLPKNVHSRIIDVLKKHNIRYCFCIGDQEAQKLASKITDLTKEYSHKMNVIGIPASVDNSISMTDHCPGYGSSTKLIATTIREMSMCYESYAQNGLVSIVEITGIKNSWMAAGSSLARRRNMPDDAPHLIYIAEIPFSKEKFLDDIQNVLKRSHFCMVVVGSNIVDKDGNYIHSHSTYQDTFGKVSFSRVSDYLRHIVQESLQVNVETTILNLSQNAAAHCASKTDIEEAFLCGKEAVKMAIGGKNGFMATLIRGETDTYSVYVGAADLNEVIENTKALPLNWINESKTNMSFQYSKYALPLILGEVQTTYENGIPKCVRLEKHKVEKMLEAYNNPQVFSTV